MWAYNDPNVLMHYGIKGMKWGVRRYQNEDGTLTPAGKARYSDDSGGGVLLAVMMALNPFITS